ncbi:MAG: CapA family protein [Bacteroidaceae bacterium]|nr:CapA family protein [Bacteroidaceae bacterium]
MKRKPFLLLTLLLLCFACQGGAQQPGAQAGAGADGAETEDTVRRVTLLFAGDLMQHQGQINAARRADGTWDYTDCFRYVRDEISSYDLAIANLEVTLPGPPYTGYPQFRAPDAFLQGALDAGFDVMLTANNHCCDSHQAGLERTIRVLDSLQVPHLGTYRTQEERDANYPLLVERNGIRIALLNYTYDTNGIPFRKPNVVNLIDRTQMAADIARAKRMNPDVIIANMHWGIEYVMTPNKQMRDLADWLLAQGVDHVIGGHPHVVQPVEVRQGKDGAKHLVVWSLGNYISNMTKDNTEVGLMVNLTLEKDSVTRLTDCGYTITFCSRPAVSGRRVHTVLPASFPQGEMRPAERERFNRNIATARRLFEKYNVGIKENNRQ